MKIKANNQIYTITKKSFEYISEDVFEIKIKGKNFKKNFYYINDSYFNGLYEVSETYFYKSLKDVKKEYHFDITKNKLFELLYELINIHFIQKDEDEKIKLEIKKILEEKNEI